jgi:predicted RNA-binding Zn-ribbon protein involved in translation (DUF1610 family)
VLRYREIERSDWLRTAALLAGYIAVMMLGVVITTAAGIVAAVVGLVLLVRWHSHAFAFRCRNCGDVFAIPVFRDLIAPHGFRRGRAGKLEAWEYLRCPHCGKRTSTTIVKRT